MMKALGQRSDFVRKTETLRNKTLFLSSAISELLKLTDDYCTFVQRYFNRGFISAFNYFVCSVIN